MTAIKIVHGLLSSSFHREAPRTKRGKTKSFPSCGMDVEHQHVRSNSDERLSNAPSLLISRALADHGIPDRLDPFSMDYLMDFDYHDGSRHCDIPTDILMAIQYGNADQLIHHYHSRDRLAAQRNSFGESLLHLACRWGSVAVVKRLLHDCKISPFVLDKQGRSPLHTLCLATNNSSMDDTTNFQTCNHLESMRLLLRESPSLILFKDKHGRVPLEYIHQSTSSTNNAPVWKKVNEILCSENIVNRVVGEMMHEMEKSRSGQRMTMWEKINSIVDLSGLDAAIMETGLSV